MSPSLPPLTRRQRQILDFLADYQSEHSLCPTLEEIASNFGVNKVTIFGHVKELERKGFIERSAPGVSRGLRLVQQDSEPERQPSSSVDVPLLGAIAAGSPIEALESPESFDLADMIPTGRDVYALRVEGTSMIEDGVRDGDVVLVERREDAHNGEMVVAILENEEATLKRFYRENERTTGKIRLQPANAELDPIFVDDVQIRGVVIGVVRRY